MPEISQYDYQTMARLLVAQYVTKKTDGDFLDIEDVYIVWFSKTLQNWKCLVSTTIPDDMYYEITYNGEKKETYLDAYKKVDNVAIPDAE